MSLAIQIQNLSAGYPGRSVISGLNLDISAGERVALLGPNGSGKSTLLRAITHGLPNQSGEVTVCGQAINRLTAAQVARLIAVVPQEESTRFAFRVRDVVSMGRIARSNGLFDTAEDREIAEKAMERADCASLADRPFTALSGGERQRVLIARALAQEAPVLLLDEPTSHLDPAHQVEVATLVGSLAQEGVTTIAAVHDLNLAARIADRALVLKDGKIEADGPVEEVLRDSTLDAVYGVTFQRIEVEGMGTLVVPFPRLTSS